MIIINIEINNKINKIMYRYNPINYNLNYIIIGFFLFKSKDMVILKLLIFILRDCCYFI